VYRGIRSLVHFGILFLIFGATYMIYATFIVTTLVDHLVPAQNYRNLRFSAFAEWTRAVA
jgi:hypothetical protein